MESSNQSLVLMRNGQKLNVFHQRCDAQKDSFCDTTLFFIHGSMGSLTQFSHQIELYRGRANIVAYDTIGCGMSEKPTTHSEYSTDSFTAHTIEIFEKYSTPRNILVGHSYGTSQIARLCDHIQKKHIEPISTIVGLVLIGTMDTLPAGGAAAFRIFSLPLCLLNPMQGWMTKTYMNMAYSSSFDPLMKDRAVTLAGKNKMYVCKAFYQQFQWATPAHWDAVSSYPILVCQGDDDKITPLDGAQSLVKLLLSQSKEKEGVVVEGGGTQRDKGETEIDTSSTVERGRRVRLAIISKAGHHAMEEQPSQLAMHMTAFFKEECGISF